MTTPSLGEAPDVNEIPQKPEILDMAQKDMEAAKQRLRNATVDDRKALREQLDSYKKTRNNLDSDEHARESAAAELLEKQLAELELEEANKPTIKEQAPVSAEQQAIKDNIDQLQKQGNNFVEKIANFLPVSWMKVLKGWMGGWGAFLEPLIQRKEIMQVMTDILEPAKVLETDQDKKLLAELNRQWNALPAEEGKPAMSFDGFYVAKIHQAKKLGKSEYTLQDIVNAKTPRQEQEQIAADKRTLDEKAQENMTEARRKQEADKAKEGKIKAEKDKLLSEHMEVPNVRQAVYTYTLAKAIAEFTTIPDLKVDEDKEEQDLQTGEHTGPWHYQVLAKNIQTFFAGEMAKKVLGVQLDGGDLEETDGSNIFYDADIITHFEPWANPKGAVESLLELKFREGNALDDGTGINKTARKKIPILQEAIKKYLKEYMGSFAPAAAQEPDQVAEAPAPTPAPAPEAAASTTPPANPSAAPPATAD